MSLGEFSLIEKYFSSFDKGEGVELGIGDDCALLQIPIDKSLAITTDTQNEGIHFFKDTEPYLIGYKSLLVNVSDLAAMGAKPYAFTLSLTLPQADEKWLEEFAKGLFSLAKLLKLPLIGGNTSKGPLSITISAYGLCDKNKSMQRCNAKEGDDIYVTGPLGIAGLAVDLGYGKKLAGIEFKELYPKSMLIPNRCEFAYKLSEISSCAIDISDGLVGDLKHILKASSKGANIYLEQLPYPKLFQELNLDEEYQEKLVLFGGGDYELIFTLSEDKKEKLEQLAQEHKVECKCIGKITKENLIFLKNNKQCPMAYKAFEHF